MLTHFLSATDLNRIELDHLFVTTDKLLNGEKINYPHILANLFFEPSTRTRMSFESASYRLNGKVISITEAQSSSLAKGESLIDTARIMSIYADIMVIRHQQPHAAQHFANSASVPVINAGDGSNEHPTQALLDLYTILRLKPYCANKQLTIGFFGDLKQGRTVHSLYRLLHHYGLNSRYAFISPPTLALPSKYEIGPNDIVTTSLDSIINDLDVLYVTRLQKERHEHSVHGSYFLSLDLAQKMSTKSIILHPLPREQEMDVRIDQLPQACYFEQARYGLFVRMALLKLLCDKSLQ